MLDRYTETLCTAQKKTSLESSLLQDIPILNGQDSLQLEDWLTDIETASELTGEGRHTSKVIAPLKKYWAPPRTRIPWLTKVGPSTGSNVGTSHVMMSTYGKPLGPSEKDLRST